MRADIASHKVGLHRTLIPISMLGMAIYRRSEEDERRIVRCAACEGTMLAEMASFGRIDANTACASCGMTLVDSPFSGGDYYEVIMRVGRLSWRGARLRRAG
jgi:ribosomal protein S27E